jgi:hypothetical protein
MKKLTFLFVGLLGFIMNSCSSEDANIAIFEPEKIITVPVLEALPAPAEFVNEEGVNDATEAGTFKWSPAVLEYKGAVSYFLEIAPRGSDFSNTVKIFEEGVSTTSHAFTFGDLNKAVNRLNVLLVSKGQPAIAFETLVDIDVRVSAVANISKNVAYSTVQQMKINAYEKIVYVTPELYLVGAPQAYYGKSGWDEKNGIGLKYVGNLEAGTKVFEGYVKVNIGDGFKFTGDGKTWDHGNYGTDGSVAAISGGQEFALINVGTSSDLKVAEVDGAGLYYVRVDLDAMKCKVIKMQWGIIGDATKGSWDSESPMTYKFSTNVWSYTGTDVTAGNLKFRSKNTGNFIFGTSGDWKFNSGVEKTAIDDGGDNFVVVAGVKPTLTINFDGTTTASGL